jgi:hypothetical protein
MYVSKQETPCQIMNKDLWMAKEGSARSKQAKVLCTKTCPELEACLRSTLRHERRAGTNFGVFGGLTQVERAALIA